MNNSQSFEQLSDDVSLQSNEEISLNTDIKDKELNFMRERIQSYDEESNQKIINKCKK